MQKKKAKRINYKIQHCSSEDQEYPVTQLIQQSTESKGWQNHKFSQPPHTIVLELIQTSTINKIAILSHQSKIATKVQFQIKVNQDDYWKKIGRISLDSNANTKYQARQLKQANINDIQAKFIRIIFRQNHVNMHNPFNQVGIISLSFYGYTSQFPPQIQERPVARQNSQMDNQTAKILRQLQNKKKKAVQSQNYDQAKRIKQQIDELKRVAQQIAGLQLSKAEAVRRQNYQDAKIINQKIKRLRQGGGRTTQIKRQILVNKPEAIRYQQQQIPKSVSPITNNKNIPVKAQQPIRSQKRQQINKRKESNNEDDDRPINVKNNNPYNEPPQQQNVEKQTQLQELNKQLHDECSQYFQTLDQSIFRHIFSKDHTNRERGIKMLEDQLQSVGKSRDAFIAACLYIIKNLIDDKIASVLKGIIKFMTQMMKKLKPPMNPNNQQNIDYILEKIADHLGHNNGEIRKQSEDAYSNFPIYNLTNKQNCYKALTIIGKRDKLPKVLSGRLNMLNKLIRQFQLGRDYEDVIKYAVKYADDKNNDVRNAAINVICSISAQLGHNSIQNYIKNLRPQIIKAIQQKLQSQGTNEKAQNYDQIPIKPKGNSKAPSRNQPQFQQGNQFIDIPKKSSVNAVNVDEICVYCKRVDKRFVQEDYMDLHMFNACPMLMVCNDCGQGIQISTLNSHLVGQCKMSRNYKKCPRCKQAVHQKNFKTHVESKECLPAKPLASANRCPLCHLDINPGGDGWLDHLVNEGCENNPRA